MSAAVAPAPAQVSRRSAQARPIHQLTWVALAIVLLVAAFTRLWHLDLIDFKADEAQIAGLALDVAQGKWPLTSIQTSGGIFNPPLPVYFFGLAALLTRDPAWQAAVIGVLDVLGVLTVYLIGQRHFCGRVGLAGAAFYAANAYANIFARKLAGPFLQPLFAALLLACLLENSKFKIQNSNAPAEARPWTWAVAAVLLAVLVQMHLGALLLAPVILVVFLLSRPTWRAMAWAGGGLVLAAILFAPYLAFEIGSQPNFLSSLAGASGAPGWGLGAFQLVWVAITSPGYGDLTGSASALFNAENWTARFVTPLAGLAVLGGLCLALWRWRDRRYLALSIFLVLPLLLMLHNSSAVRIHYFVFLEPAIFLLGGVGFDALLCAWPRLRVPAFALLGLLLVVQSASLARFTRFIQQHALPADSYGLPLAYQQRLFDSAFRLAGDARVVAAVDGRDQADPAAYFLRGRSHAEVDAATGLLLPARGVYVTFGQRTPPTEALSSALAPVHTEALPGQLQAVVYQVDNQALPKLRSTLGLQARQPQTWQDGISLSGLTAPRSVPGQLVAEWHIERQVDSSTTMFNQLVDDSGKQWFDDDSVPVSANDWRAGDTLIAFTRAALASDAPLQEYWWTVGLYQEGGRRIPLANGDSQLRLARLKGGTPSGSNLAFQPADATFDSAVRLSGYAIDASGITLRWSSLRPLDRDYTVFVHALDSGGKLLAQADGQPSDGHYPTSLWDPGETVIDRHALTVPPGAHLEVGLYDLSTGQRLRLPGGSDQLTLAPSP